MMCKRSISASLGGLLLLAGCSSKHPEEKPAAPPAPAAVSAPHPRAAVGEFGLDLAAGDPSVKAGDDFFFHANGHWYQTFQIPPDRSSFGAFVQLTELSTSRVRMILEQASTAGATGGTPTQKIGDYYASFMDQSGIESRGLAPAQADLQKIQAARSRRDIAALFGSPGFASLFDVQLPPDLKNPDRYSIVISQSSLGLPDRDYYLKPDPALEQLRPRYVAYVEQILELGSVPHAHEMARKIFEFETQVAKRQWAIEQRRDVDKTYNPRTRKELIRCAPGFSWDTFLTASELGGREQLVLSEITAIRDIAALFARTPLPTLRGYLTFRYLSDHAQYLPRRFDQAAFEFYGRTMRGQPQQRERWKRGVDAVNEALGEQVGQIYVQEYFPPRSKAMMEELVANLRASLADRIDHLDWMTDATKARAREKLAAFTPKIGYPEHWKDYSGLEVVRDDVLGNARRGLMWHWRYQVERLDRPVDRSEWQMTPQEVNAYYNPLNNEIVFPAAILQPPFFDPNADSAVNYGGIGATIGHEMGHGFDDQGRKFGPHGNLEDWWTPQDAAVFKTRVDKLISQYNRFEALPGLKVNGANTVGENIGDLGGLNMAYHAYQLSLHGQPAPVIGGLSGDQRFFLSWAQVWRAKYREGLMRELVLSDVHSPSRFRVNGPLPNMAEWYSAFGVAEGDKLYIDPAERVSIW
jgi:putative endopeptidase